MHALKFLIYLTDNIPSVFSVQSSFPVASVVEISQLVVPEDIALADIFVDGVVVGYVGIREDHKCIVVAHNIASRDAVTFHLTLGGQEVCGLFSSRRGPDSSISIRLLLSTRPLLWISYSVSPSGEALSNSE
jgi:hypothetical protein